MVTLLVNSAVKPLSHPSLIYDPLLSHLSSSLPMTQHIFSHISNSGFLSLIFPLLSDLPTSWWIRLSLLLLHTQFSFGPFPLISLCSSMTRLLTPSLCLAHFLLLSVQARSHWDQREEEMERGKANLMHITPLHFSSTLRLLNPGPPFSEDLPETLIPSFLTSYSLFTHSPPCCLTCMAVFLLCCLSFIPFPIVSLSSDLNAWRQSREWLKTHSDTCGTRNQLPLKDSQDCNMKCIREGMRGENKDEPPHTETVGPQSCQEGARHLGSLLNSTALLVSEPLFVIFPFHC